MGNIIKMKFLFFAAVVAATETWSTWADMETHLDSNYGEYEESVELTADNYDNTVEVDALAEQVVVIAFKDEAATFTLQTHSTDSTTLTDVGTLTTYQITTETPNYYSGARVFYVPSTAVAGDVFTVMITAAASGCPDLTAGTCASTTYATVEIEIVAWSWTMFAIEAVAFLGVLAAIFFFMF